MIGGQGSAGSPEDGTQRPDQSQAADESSGGPQGPSAGAIAEERTRGQAVPLWPPFPLAKRLNRNALTVAAALAGITVLTVVVVTRPTRVPPTAANGATVATGEAEAPAPARPAFLDQPPRQSPAAARGEDPRSGDGSVGVLGLRHGNHEAEASGLPVPPPLPGASDADLAGSSPDVGVENAGPQSGSSTAMRPPSAIGPSTRAQAYQAALVSPVMVPDLDSRTVSGAAPSNIAQRPAIIRDSSTAALAGVNDTTNSPTNSSRVASRLALEVGAPTVAQPDAPGSPYVVRAGAVIPGLLLTGINSDLPGEILGQTSRDVFDSRTQQILLIPRGSRLIGSYDNRSAVTGRLIVAWTRLIFPDGRSLTLPRLAATDEHGQAGLHDEVNHHYGRVYGAALLTSVISAGVQLSQPQQSALYAAPSSRQVAAGALGQNLGDAALESAKRGLDTPPTITIRPGQGFDVFLAGDIRFDGPYVAAPLSMGR
jgi:type IV secretory pathway VirB10-like protein